MRQIKDTKAESRYIGTLPDGCLQCIKGQKSVLFLTGLCNKACFYCPLSEQRKGKGDIWINERKVEKDSDIIDEIRKCSSKGVGITGGEPLRDIKRFYRYVKMLKDEFGKDFHIHAYTKRTDLTEKDMENIEESGLDALRFHIFNIEKLPIKSKPELRTAIEIPVIPGEEKKIKRLIKDADSIIDYINLNELEFSDTNCKEMEKRGFQIRDNDDYAVKGSKELSLELLRFAKENTKNISVHFCTASTKYNFQYWNRLKRRAKNIKEPWEIVTKEGLIKKGIINEGLGTMSRLLPKNTYTKRRNRIETSIKNAKEAAKKGYKAAIVLEMPTADPFDFELTPLDKKGKEVE